MELGLFVIFVLASFVWVQLNIKRRAAWFAYLHVSSPHNRKVFEDLDSKAIHLTTWLIVLLLFSLGLTWFQLFK